MLKTRADKAFYGMNLVLVCIFAALIILLGRIVPENKTAEYIIMIVLLLISFVISSALNCALYIIRRKPERDE